MKAVDNVQYIGKIDLEIYRVVTDDIRTDNVVLSDAQRKHIQESHPEDYKEYSKHLQVILKEPDYILESNKPFTAIVLKEIVTNEKKFKLILRLQTSNDPTGFMNSVITFQHVEAKRYRRYIKNAKILYQREGL
ncbi:PBECR2 nuclease fold domain-containing protein [Selenomonas sp. AE3005]|uniref:PBECR2 nuclease fold domain-containing protein n=1 Tax=Selenomonas sp. AE3005 TaxID=1485543 RepID=UPI0025FD207D|nr:PBECR2 nuclease fold domain-containing protein [Selenomonas sp. AE3005]